MKIGDVQVYLGDTNMYYTKNKKYYVYRINSHFIPGTICGHIMNDIGDSVYFRDDDIDRNWIDLKKYRKEKINNLNNIYEKNFE